MQLQTLNWPKGELTAVWTAGGLCRLTFGRMELPGTVPMTNAEARLAGPRALSSALAEYFDNCGEFDFPLEHLDWTGVPEFHRQVLKCCAQIARGQFMTYGQLAAAAGSPQAARAVGQAMARNRWPLVVPCHRVIGQTGKLTGYSGLGGIDTKLWLLEMEGISVASLKASSGMRQAFRV